MTQKEILQKSILVLDSLGDKSDLFYRDIQNLMDEIKWKEVYSFLSANSGRALIVNVNQITKRDKFEFAALRNKWASQINRIEQEEYSETLADKANKSQIYHNRHTTIVAYLALLVSILATTQLPQKFYDWMRGLFSGF